MLKDFDMDYRMSDWCERACSHIKYKPDRKDVAEELLAHMQDKYDALIAAGIPLEEAAYAYTVSSEREHRGFFIFEFHSTVGADEHEKLYESRAYFTFALAGDSKLHGSSTGMSYPASIRLYDSAGSLVYEQEMELFA